MKQNRNPFISLKLLLILVVSMLISVSLANAQETCPEKLIQAASNFDQGRIDEAIDLCNSCKTSENLSDRWQAYRLLSMAYLVNNQPKEARTAAEFMLEIHPVYEADLLNDTKEFTQLLGQIEIIPKFSLGITAMYGANYSIPNVTGFYAPTDYVKDYKNIMGSQMGVVMGYNPGSRHRIDLTLMSKTRKYGMSYTAFDNAIEIEETLRTFDFPILYHYSLIPKNAIKVGVSVGGYGSILLNSFNDLSLVNSEASHEVKHYSSKTRRNVFNYGLCGGIEVTKKVKTGRFSLIWFTLKA